MSSPETDWESSLCNDSQKKALKALLLLLYDEQTKARCPKTAAALEPYSSLPRHHPECAVLLLDLIDLRGVCITGERLDGLDAYSVVRPWILETQRLYCLATPPRLKVSETQS